MAGRRRALIVANGEYDNAGLQRLGSPAADADALAGVLADRAISDFDVQVVRNETAHVVQAEIEDLCAEGRPDDVLLLHFSCHGLKDDSGGLYFAARNTRPDRLRSTAVPAQFVQQCVSQSRSRSIVLLLDCCYGGAFGQGVAVRSSGDANVLDSFRGGRGRAVITASNSIEYAFEGAHLAEGQPARPSVFTSALVEGLRTGEADRDEDGWIALGELYEYLFDRVRERNPKQTPSRDIEMQGELYLAKSRRRRIKPSPIPADLSAAITAENPFTRLGAVAELRRRLSSDNLPVAMGAFEALKVMASTDIEHIAAAASDALGDVAVRVDSPAIHLSAPAGEPGTATVRALGPPVAREVRFEPSHPWIAVTEVDGGANLMATAGEKGTRRGKLVVTGPTGDVVVEVEIDAIPAPEPAPAPTPAPAYTPAPEPTRATNPAPDPAPGTAGGSEPVPAPAPTPQVASAPTPVPNPAPGPAPDLAPGPAAPDITSGPAAGSAPGPAAARQAASEPALPPASPAAPVPTAAAEATKRPNVAFGASDAPNATLGALDATNATWGRVPEPEATPEVGAGPGRETEAAEAAKPATSPETAPAVAAKPAPKAANLPEPAVEAKQAPEPAPAAAAEAAKLATPPGQTAAAAAGAVDPVGGFAGIAAITGAVFAVVGLGLHYRYGEPLTYFRPGMETYVGIVAACATLAGILALAPRTRTRTGPALLLGTGLAGLFGLLRFLGDAITYTADSDAELGAGYTFLLLAHVAWTIAAVCAAVILRKDAGRARGRPDWAAVGLGVLLAAAWLTQLGELSRHSDSEAGRAAAYFLVGAILAVLIPAVAISLRSGWAVLATGTAGLAGVLVPTFVAVAGHSTVAGQVIASSAILLLVVDTVVLARRNQPIEGQP
ncbi:caspase family protein [Amycolatopsis sp. FBCC-B4732]|uniref:caspase, EACC1-associated type n=1 Tax=Amycolatopsis sp. FBCC-B4732 TaxID=3079339 RepID=UPI001FF3690D|nr:caspase family protein [Amycolatopsis sp. FBCC-B4732]UOX85553.1 caspase family protein [Amycolatopsis sp. FBCC-B4732]